MLYPILISLAIGIAGGWLVKDWKDRAELALVQSQKKSLEDRNSILEAANHRCATDIDGVRKGVESISIAVGEREKAAAAAMLTAQELAAKHSRAAQALRNAPPVPKDQQCAAIEQEQIEYVTLRRAEHE